MYGMKPGARVRLVKMTDPYPVPPGTIGTVLSIDCNGDLEMEWSNGSTLKLIPEADTWEVISSEEDPAPHSIDIPSHRSG